jgi:chromosome segregation ATPase
MSEERFDRIEARLDRIDTTLTNITESMTILQQNMLTMQQNLNATRDDISSLRNRVDSIEGTVLVAIRDGFRIQESFIDDLNYDLSTNERKTRRLSRRVGRLEQKDDN